MRNEYFSLPQPSVNFFSTCFSPHHSNCWIVLPSVLKVSTCTCCSSFPSHSPPPHLLQTPGAIPRAAWVLVPFLSPISGQAQPPPQSCPLLLTAVPTRFIAPVFSICGLLGSTLCWPLLIFSMSAVYPSILFCSPFLLLLWFLSLSSQKKRQTFIVLRAWLSVIFNNCLL